MIETLKFINIKKHTLNQSDRNILKWEYQKLMDSLYQTLKNPPFSAAKQLDNKMRDIHMKNIIQEIKDTHVLIGYLEIISDTDKENVKKLSIVIGDDDKKYSEMQLVILKEKLKKAYDIYNQVISKPGYTEPFLERDGKFLFKKNQIKLERDTENKDGDTLSNRVSTMIDMVINKLDKKGL